MAHYGSEIPGNIHNGEKASGATPTQNHSPSKIPSTFSRSRSSPSPHLLVGSGLRSWRHRQQHLIRRRSCDARSENRGSLGKLSASIQENHSKAKYSLRADDGNENDERSYDTDEETLDLVVRQQI